jgi:hypothetical protein
MVALNLGEWDVKLSFLQELQVVCHATTGKQQPLCKDSGSRWKNIWQSFDHFLYILKYNIIEHTF